MVERSKNLRWANWLWNECPCVCFGGFSYGAFSNYILKITVIENKNKFGEELAQICKTTFFGQPGKVSNEWRCDSSVNKEGYRNLPWRKLQSDKFYQQQGKGCAMSPREKQANRFLGQKSRKRSSRRSSFGCTLQFRRWFIWFSSCTQKQTNDNERGIVCHKFGLWSTWILSTISSKKRNRYCKVYVSKA